MAQTTNTERPAQEMTWDQRLLRNSGRQKAALKPEYQELKFTLHRKLVDKINLEALATIDNQRVRSEVRQALIGLLDSEPTLLSAKCALGKSVNTFAGQLVSRAQAEKKSTASLN